MEKALQNLVWERSKSICEYCRMPSAYDELPFQIDHIIALKHQGDTVGDNLALACFSCNNHKGPNIAGIDPDTGELSALFHPRTDNWSTHFQWQGSTLHGRTPIGRTTVVVLNINLPHRIDLRSALISEGVFPLHDGPFQ